jgi:hypothetical protein
MNKKDKSGNKKYANYSSNKLGFSISIPSNWKVNTGGLEAEPGLSREGAYEAFRQTFPDSSMTLEEFKQQSEQPRRPASPKEAYEKLLEEQRASALSFEKFNKIYDEDRKKAYKSFFETCLGTPTDEDIEKEYVSRDLSAEKAYKRLMKNPETFLISFEEFEQQYKEEQERKRERGKKREELSQMEEGYFEASPPDDENYPSVEVTKLNLTRSMSPLELYQLDKLSHEEALQGIRPSKEITVDGLQGVKYYCIYDTGETRNETEMPKYFNVYLIEEQTGWIITCSCLTKVFSKYKEVFTKIISSFRRI